MSLPLESLDAAWNSYYKPLVLFANGYLKDMEDAKDCVSHVFYRLAIKNGDEGGYNKAILYISVKNKAIDLLRLKKRRPGMEKALSDYLYSGSDLKIIEAEALTLIYQRMQKLPERQRDIIVLYLKGFKYIDIAHKIKTNAGNVQSLKDIAVRTLRQFVKEHKLNAQ